MDSEDGRLMEIECLKAIFAEEMELEDSTLLDTCNTAVLAGAVLNFLLRLPCDEGLPKASLHCELPPGYPERSCPRFRVECFEASAATLQAASEKLAALAVERLGEPSVFDIYNVFKDDILRSCLVEAASQPTHAEEAASAPESLGATTAIPEIDPAEAVVVVRVKLAADFPTFLAKARDWARRDGLEGAIFYRVSPTVCRAEDIFVVAVSADATAAAAFLGNLGTYQSGGKGGSRRDVLDVLFNSTTGQLRTAGRLPWGRSHEVMPEFEYTDNPGLATTAIGSLGLADEVKTFRISKSRFLSDEWCLHQYSTGYQQFGLPVPKRGSVLGIIGKNGSGKSTVLDILSGALEPNFGKVGESPGPHWQSDRRVSKTSIFWNDVKQRGLRPVVKKQYVERLADEVKGAVGDLLKARDERSMYASIVEDLGLSQLLSRQVSQLSGGELQRFAIALAAVQDGKLYFIDEPSSYLDIKQRIIASKVVSNLSKDDAYVVVVEHDLAVLDYVSDDITITFGKPGQWGISHFMSWKPKTGMNIFLKGTVPYEELRFREAPLSFSPPENRAGSEKIQTTCYPELTKTLDGFKLCVASGDFAHGEIIVLLGQNGSGKSTLVKMLAGQLKPDENSLSDLSELKVSMKPQEIKVKFQGTVRELLDAKIDAAMRDLQFQFEVVRPMSIDHLMDKVVRDLSGGELQRLALVLNLGRPADIYLVDEPSAYLDVEQRIAASQVIKRFILRQQKTAFVAEHDFVMATYLADRVIVYEGEPGVQCRASAPQPFLSGMNRFLEQLQVTFRRDEETFRPRINKPGSVKDREQRQAGQYLVLED